MSLPLLHPAILVGYLVALAVASVSIAVTARGDWARQRERVRRLVVAHLKVSQDDFLTGRFLQQILALVPARVVVARGPLASLAGTEGVWLCFIPRRILVVPGKKGDVIELRFDQIRGLYLAEPSSVKTALAAAVEGTVFAVETAEGLSAFQVDRVDDVVRILNLLTHQGAELRYLNKVE